MCVKAWISMKKFPYTLFHTSYASGNFMLVYNMNATQSGTMQVQWSRVAVEHCGEIKEFYYICIQEMKSHHR